MAISQIGSTVTASNAGLASLTQSYTQGAGVNRALVAIVATEGAVTHDSVTFNGVALTKAVEQASASDQTISMWVLTGPAETTANIVVTLSGISDHTILIAHSWSEVNQTTPFRSTAGNLGNSTAIQVVVPTSEIDDLVIDGFTSDTNGSVTVGPGQTQIGFVTNPSELAMAGSSREDGASGAVTMSWTGPLDFWAAIGGSLQYDPCPIAKLGTDTTQTFVGATVNDKTFSWNHTLVAGTDRMIVVAVGGETFDSDLGNPWVATSVTYGGVQMNKAIGVVTTENAAGLSNNDSELWYLFESDLPANGTHTIQATCSTTISGAVRLFGSCSSYQGVSSQSIGDTDGVGFNQTVPSDTIGNNITLAENDWAFSSYVSGNAGSFTVGQNQIEILDATLDSTVTYGSCELRGALGTETTLESTFVSGANRLTRVCMVINCVSTCYNAGSVNETNIPDQFKVNTVPCDTIASVNTV